MTTPTTQERRVTLTLSFLALMPTDEGAGDAVADRIGDEIVYAIQRHHPAEVFFETIAVEDWSEVPLET